MKYLKGNQTCEEDSSRFVTGTSDIGLIKIQLCGYKTDTTQYEEIFPILDPDNPVTETSKKHSVNSEKDSTPRIEYCRFKTGKMFGAEGLELTKQVYTVSICRFNV